MTLSQSKKSQLHQSACPQPFYIHIESFYTAKDTNITYYVIQVGVKKENGVQVKNMSIRYSELDKLNRELHTQFPNNTEFAPFPPKKYIFNTSMNFLKKRSEDLQNYLSALTKIPHILESQEFRDMFQIEGDFN